LAVAVAVTFWLPLPDGGAISSHAGCPLILHSAFEAMSNVFTSSSPEAGNDRALSINPLREKLGLGSSFLQAVKANSKAIRTAAAYRWAEFKIPPNTMGDRKGASLRVVVFLIVFVILLKKILLNIIIFVIIF